MNEAGHRQAGIMVKWSSCVREGSTAAEGAATPPGRWTPWWPNWRRGPWTEAVLRRLPRALAALAARLSERGDLAAVVLFGSYARGEYGRKSDVDLLVLFEGTDNPELDGRGGQVAEIVSELEAAERLPMNIVALSGLQKHNTLHFVTGSGLTTGRDGVYLPPDAEAGIHRR